MSNHHPLVEAYRRMLERLNELNAKEQEVFQRLQNSLDHVVDQAVELDEITREEANIVAGYLKRDLQDAGQHLAETGQELNAWLRFDTQLLEQQMLDWFAQAADNTRMYWLEWEKSQKYYTGEVTGPGTLQCEQCGAQLQFHAPAMIANCPDCDGEVFSRANDENE